MLFASANAQMALISDLLDFSRMESGNRQLVVEPFEPAAVLRDVAEMMRVAADRKAITLDGHWEPLDALTVIGDQHAFRQIVTNLVGNAVKFTDTGGVTLTARAAPGGRRGRASSSPSRTPGAAFPPTRCRTSSSGSTRSTARSAATPRGPASGSRSARTSPG